MKMPEGITKHPGVKSCVTGESEWSDYKYWVFLNDGWTFQNGRMAGCGDGAGFNSVADFKYSNPIKTGA